jgi:4-amino-4-deoxy-L-arabinose transferase-like glycosyltransferase
VGQLRTIRRVAPRSWAARLLLVVAGGLAARVAYVLLVMPDVELGFDAIWYWFQSSTIADGAGYLDVETYFQSGRAVATAGFPPLWPALLAVVDKVGIDGDRAFELTGAVLGAGTVALTGLVGRRVGGSRIGLLAAALVAVCPALIAADGSLMSESLYVPLVTLAVLVAYEADRRPVLAWAAALGGVLGLAALTRGDALLLAPVLIGVVGWRTRAAWTRRLVFAGIACVALMVVVTPWTIRSSRALGEVVLVSSNSGSLLEGANCRSAYEGEMIGLWDPACLHFTRRPGLTEAEYSSRARSRAITYAREHLGDLPEVLVMRALRLAGLYEPVTQARSEAIESRNADWQVVAWAYWIVLLPFAAAGAVWLRRRGDDVGPLLAVIAGVLLIGVLSWGNQRFRLAAEPAVLVLAAGGLAPAVRWCRAQFAPT